ncbi:hypothetical protein, partial [Faecalibacterium prausnitzii]|uniref:hypothetical protein n=1 Tax=Faecalibacterium prausnitzii TaxID=853 RepID=UPI001A9C2158
ARRYFTCFLFPECRPYYRCTQTAKSVQRPVHKQQQSQQFHPIQEYLLPHNIEFFLEGLSSDEIVSVTDLFQLKLLFFRVNSVPVAI